MNGLECDVPARWALTTTVTWNDSDRLRVKVRDSILPNLGNPGLVTSVSASRDAGGRVHLASRLDGPLAGIWKGILT